GLTGTGTGPTDASGNASFNITGSTAGIDTVKATFVDSLGTTHTSNNVTVTWEAPITATGKNVSATEGAAFTGAVASFSDPDTGATAGEYTATINWGDATTSAGTVSGPTGGPFSVNGTHTYAEEGSYSVTVTITDADFASNSATTRSTATVADAALTATCAT